MVQDAIHRTAVVVQVFQQKIYLAGNRILLRGVRLLKSEDAMQAALQMEQDPRGSDLGLLNAARTCQKSALVVGVLAPVAMKP